MEKKPILNNIVNNKKVVNVFANLYFRWQDEKEYEDFADYIKVMEKSIVEALLTPITIIKGTKRPFGVQFSYLREKYHLFLKTDRKSIWLAIKKL